MIDNRRKSVDAYMPLWIGDYLADTTHLDTVQHGAYLLLLMAYWRKGGPLPADEPTLARITKLTTHKWKAIRPVIAALFIEDGGVWRSKRADAELEKANALKAARSASGRKGAEVSNANRTGRAVYEMPHSVKERVSKTQGGFEAEAYQITEGGFGAETAETSHVNLGNADVLPSAKPQPSPSPIRTRTDSSPDTQRLMEPLLVCVEQRKLPERPAQKPKAIRGRRWGADERVPAEWLEAGAAKRAERGLPKIDMKALAENFENYWASASGGYAVKLDWYRTWMNRVMDVHANGVYANGKANSGQFGRRREVIDDHPLGNFAAIADRLGAEREGGFPFDA